MRLTSSESYRTQQNNFSILMSRVCTLSWTATRASLITRLPDRHQPRCCAGRACLNRSIDNQILFGSESGPHRKLTYCGALKQTSGSMSEPPAADLDFDTLCELVEWVKASSGYQEQAVLQGGVRAFSRQQALTWLQGGAPGVAGEAQADAVLRQLRERNLVVPWPQALVGGGGSGGSGGGEGGGLLALAGYLPTPPEGAAALNVQFQWQGPGRSALEVSESLRRQLLMLYGQYVDEDGKLVDYRAMAADPAFGRYTVMASELQKVDPLGLTREQRLAFLVNVYNSLVIHANTVYPPAKSLLGRLKFFDTIRYDIGGTRYSANDIEHGLLRDNAVSPTSVGPLLGLGRVLPPGLPMLSPRWFKEGDPRLQLTVSPPDPRIHFALNCGAVSCPAIRVYNEKNVEIGLAAAAKTFIRGEVEVLPDKNQVVMSKIFKWYGGDFGKDTEQLLRYVLQYMTEDEQKKLQSMLDSGQRIKLQYKEYDWSVNAKPSSS